MADPSIFMKRCNRCHEIKPMEAFSRCSVREDGRQKRCRACNNAYSRDRTKELNARGLTQRGIVGPGQGRYTRGRTGPENRPISYARNERRWQEKAGGIWYGGR